MARLIHLNGPPGIGKSTIARRYVEEHPGVLNCDIDVLRTLIGGWQQDFDGAGNLIRPAALAFLEGYLGTGRDVVMPQLIVRPTELARFTDAAARAGAEYVHCMLVDDLEASVARFHQRAVRDPLDEQVRAAVTAVGGDEALARLHAGLASLAGDTAGTVVVRTLADDVDGTYAAVVSRLRPPDGLRTSTTDGGYLPAGAGSWSGESEAVGPPASSPSRKP